MPPITSYKPFEFQLRLKKPELWIVIVVTIIGLSILQDYLFSRVQHTGFYLSESLLYNSIWAFLLPFTLIQTRLLKLFHIKSDLKKFMISIASSTVFTLLHLLVFSAFFVLVSSFVFSPAHRVSQIFNTAFSNQLYILALFYGFVPFIFQRVESNNQTRKLSMDKPERLKVKTGLKTISLQIETVEFISTEKPYSVIHSAGRQFLDNRTLKDLENTLVSTDFIRVHRSTIINKHFVKELKSRQNGDYDCTLHSGRTIRLSRHYKANWQSLLQ